MIKRAMTRWESYCKIIVASLPHHRSTTFPFLIPSSSVHPNATITLLTSASNPLSPSSSSRIATILNNPLTISCHGIPCLNVRAKIPSRSRSAVRQTSCQPSMALTAGWNAAKTFVRAPAVKPRWRSKMDAARASITRKWVSSLEDIVRDVVG